MDSKLLSAGDTLCESCLHGSLVITLLTLNPCMRCDLSLHPHRAEITFQSDRRPLLMFTPSLNRSPVAPVFLAYSLPARSTMWNFADSVLSPFLCYIVWCAKRQWRESGWSMRSWLVGHQPQHPVRNTSWSPQCWSQESLITSILSASSWMSTIHFSLVDWLLSR